jgi:RNA polymerase sigma-70 factor (ECF subfamily)
LFPRLFEKFTLQLTSTIESPEDNARSSWQMNDRPIRVALSVASGEGMTILDEACAAYEEERNLILRYLLSLGAPLADAQELTQEVFLAYYAALRNGARIATRRAWLFAVASRMFLNFKKSQAIRTSLPIEYQPASQIADPSATPEARVLAEEQIRAVREAIQGLSTQQKICIHLRGEGLHYREIADILGISVAAVAEFLRRAIVRIRKVVHG